jgi:hypothetical protein
VKSHFFDQNDNELMNAARIVREELGDQGRILTPLELLSKLRARGHRVNPDFLVRLFQLVDRRASRDCLAASPKFAGFIAKLLTLYKARTIHLPWVQSASIAAQLATIMDEATVTATVADADCGAMLTLLDDQKKVTVIEEDPLEQLARMQQEVDAFVCIPPQTPHRSDLNDATIFGSDLAIGRNLADHFLAYATSRLNSGGIAIFVVPTRFIQHWHDNPGFVEIVRAHRVRLRALFELPPGTFFPGVPKVLNLAVFDLAEQREFRLGHDQSEGIFVGRYDDDEQRQLSLLHGLENHHSRDLANGQWLDDMSKYRGLGQLEAERRLKSLAKRLDLRSVPTKRLFESIVTLRRNIDTDCPQGANIIYVPDLDRKDVVRYVDDMTDKGQYFAINVNEELCNPDFLVSFLNTQVGLEFRRAVSDDHPFGFRINLRVLRDNTIYLPPKNTQVTLRHAVQRIEALKAELTLMEEMAWGPPMELAKATEELRRFSSPDSLETWLETLPFPMASILWNYHAGARTFEAKVRTLNHFFEGFAEFLATVHLSAWSVIPDSSATVSLEIRKMLAQHNLSLETATFGTWNGIIELLSYRARLALSSDEDITACLRMYHTHNLSVVQRLSSSRLLNILRSAGQIRNRKLAHGGAASERVFEQLHDDLYSLLKELQKELGYVWSSYQLVHSGPVRRRQTVYLTTIQRVMGTRTPFPSAEIELDEAIEDSQLHLWDPEERTALQLLPFVKLMPSPGTELNACYFYNRSQQDGHRFVSYHFSSANEVTGNFDDVAACLKEFGAP